MAYDLLTFRCRSMDKDVLKLFFKQIAFVKDIRYLIELLKIMLNYIKIK